MVLICKRCGKPFGAMSGNAKYCVDCKTEMKKGASAERKKDAPEVILARHHKEGGIWQWGIA